MRISDWSSDVCSSDLGLALGAGLGRTAVQAAEDFAQVGLGADRAAFAVVDPGDGVLADVGGGGGDAIGAAVVVRLVVLAQRGGDAVALRRRLDRQSTRLNSSHQCSTRMPSSA